MYLMLQHKNLLIIGKDNRYFVKNLDTWKIEDMLNILMQFSLIRSYERICGDVFRVTLRLKPKADVLVIHMIKFHKTIAS